MLKRVVFILLLLILSGCTSYIRQKYRDNEKPYTIVEKTGDFYRVRMRFRPDDKQDNIYIAGSFNDWSYPGQQRSGKFYSLNYDLKSEYWVIDLFLKKGVYYYIYIVDGKRVVVDWKSEVKNPNGTTVGRLMVR